MAHPADRTHRTTAETAAPRLCLRPPSSTLPLSCPRPNSPPSLAFALRRRPLLRAMSSAQAIVAASLPAARWPSRRPDQLERLCTETKDGAGPLLHNPDSSSSHLCSDLLQDLRLHGFEDQVCGGGADARGAGSLNKCANPESDRGLLGFGLGSIGKATASSEAVA